MPLAPRHPCSATGCHELVPRGVSRCTDHARQQEQDRGTAHARGYNRAWLAFRPRFLAHLVQAGLVPVCGAALPNGPTTRDSACRDAGLLTFASADGSSLHLDHEPALEDWERQNLRAVCDPLRVQLLCASCHARKTGREQLADRGSS